MLSIFMWEWTSEIGSFWFFAQYKKLAQCPLRSSCSIGRFL